MKFTLTSAIVIALLTVAGSGLTSCSQKEGQSKTPAAKAAPAKAGDLPNYRYIDADTVLAKYNLSKDFDEQMIRMQNDFDSEARKHENSLRGFENSMRQKMQNNAYTEATYKEDQNRMAQMSNNAQQALGKKQESMQEAAAKAQKILNDSIQNFIEVYNKAHGYDAIFYKGATVYIDPRLDITDEVIEGLNARYNKVKK